MIAAIAPATTSTLLAFRLESGLHVVVHDGTTAESLCGLMGRGDDFWSPLVAHDLCPTCQSELGGTR